MQIKMNTKKTKYMVVKGIRKGLRNDIILKCLNSKRARRYNI